MKRYYDLLENARFEVDLHVESLKAELDKRRDEILEAIDKKAVEEIK